MVDMAAITGVATASAIMKHRKLAAVLAAVLIAGNAGTGLAQGTGKEGVPPSSDAPGDRPPSGTPQARTLADVKEETEAGLTYQPCPANVRFSNGQQMCLGLPGNPFYRPYHSPKQAQ
jgi:hypothetical protein